MYLLTCESDHDGCWWGEPEGYDTTGEARSAAARLGQPPMGYSRVIYYCRSYEIVTYDEVVGPPDDYADQLKQAAVGLFGVEP